MNAASLQQQILELQSQLALLQESSAQTISSLRAELAASQQESKLLRGKLDAFIRRFFGKRSEVFSTAQLELLLCGLDPVAAVTSPEAAPKNTQPGSKPKRNGTTKVRTPDNLEVVKVVIEPKDVQAQPEQWKQITQEVTRQLDYQPGKFFWLEAIRPKYVKKQEKSLPPVVAPAPERASVKVRGQI